MTVQKLREMIQDLAPDTPVMLIDDGNFDAYPEDFLRLGEVTCHHEGDRNAIIMKRRVLVIG